MAVGESDRRDSLAKGTILRDYTIEGVLGHGGFGIVYRARHTELGHLVAIKEYLPAELAVRDGNAVTPRSSHCNEHYLDGLRRFRDEASALVNLPSHPNVITCREFFRGNGTAYLVMDFIEGQPLSEVLRRHEAQGRPFGESELLAVAIPLAEALGHVHRAGMLHRDVKPANILIRSNDGQPVLIDFGTAKRSIAENTKSLAPYTEGYASPEQVADGRLGPWTDMYGFGALLWRIVAGGSQSFKLASPTKVESRMNARLRGDTDPLPSAGTLGEHRFSELLLTAIDSCLVLDENARIRDSHELLEILTRSVDSTTEIDVHGTREQNQFESHRQDQEQEIIASRRSRRSVVLDEIQQTKRIFNVLTYAIYATICLAGLDLLFQIEAIWLLHRISFLITSIIYLRWIYIAKRNAQILGGYEMQMTPAMAVGSYFIPIKNIWRPFRAIKESFQASNPAYLAAIGQAGRAGEEIAIRLQKYMMLDHHSKSMAIRRFHDTFHLLSKDGKFELRNYASTWHDLAEPNRQKDKSGSPAVLTFQKEVLEPYGINRDKLPRAIPIIPIDRSDRDELMGIWEKAHDCGSDSTLQHHGLLREAWLMKKSHTSKSLETAIIDLLSIKAREEALVSREALSPLLKEIEIQDTRLAARTTKMVSRMARWSINGWQWLPFSSWESLWGLARIIFRLDEDNPVIEARYWKQFKVPHIVLIWWFIWMLFVVIGLFNVAFDSRQLVDMLVKITHDYHLDSPTFKILTNPVLDTWSYLHTNLRDLPSLISVHLLEIAAGMGCIVVVDMLYIQQIRRTVLTGKRHRLKTVLVAAIALVGVILSLDVIVGLVYLMLFLVAIVLAPLHLYPPGSFILFFLFGWPILILAGIYHCILWILRECGFRIRKLWNIWLNPDEWGGGHKLRSFAP